MARHSMFFRYSLLNLRDIHLSQYPLQLEEGQEEEDLPNVPSNLHKSRHGPADSDSVFRMYSQACDFREQFLHSKDEDTLRKAIELDRQGLSLTSNRASNRSSNDSSIETRTSNGSSLSSLSAEIHSSSWSYFHACFLYCLAYDLCTQYEERFEESHYSDIQESIKQLLKLLKSPSLDDALRQFALEDLSWNFQLLYKEEIDPEGLSRAIDYSRTAHDLLYYSQNATPFVPESNLVFYLHSRYEAEGRTGDIDEAIKTARRDLFSSHQPLNSDRRFKLLAMHTCNLRERARLEGHEEDLEETVRFGREILDYCPVEDRAIWLSLLANDLSQLFRKQKDLSYLQEAIDADHEVLELLPSGHEQYEQSIKNLWLDLSEFLVHLADADILVDLIRCGRRMMKQSIEEAVLNKVAGYFEALSAEAAYRHFLTLVFEWWQDRLHTNAFFQMVSPFLSSKASLFEDLMTLMALKECGRTHIYTDNDEQVDFVTYVSSSKEGHIFAASPRAKSLDCTIDTSEKIREVLRSKDPMARLISIDPILTPSIMQLIQMELDSEPDGSSYRRTCIRTLQKLSRAHRILPPSLFMKDVRLERSSMAGGGGFANIWKGRSGDKPACLKVLRMFLDSDAKMRSKVLHAFCNEALVWRQLSHPNILPLLGVNTTLFSPSFCLISPWMKNGDVNEYMKDHPNFDKLTALTEIAAGLHYLHNLSPPIAHGDIRGANILVTDDEHCCLADFGLALVAETQTLTSTTEMRGAVRWMCPELIDPSAFPEYDRHDRLPRDVYAFGCTVVEILTGKPPFFGQSTIDSAIIMKVLDGDRPPRPRDVWFPDKLWNLVERCWAQEPRERPSVDDIHRVLQSW